LRELDADLDGIIERASVPERWRTVFDRLDTDRDGRVRIDEVERGGDGR
jgi:hypothetical protein